MTQNKLEAVCSTWKRIDRQSQAVGIRFVRSSLPIGTDINGFNVYSRMPNNSRTYKNPTPASLRRLDTALMLDSHKWAIRTTRSGMNIMAERIRD